jgi:hypothetical protein
MSRSTRTITAGIAAFAALAPAAVAMPSDGPVQTSSPAGTTSVTRQDLRSPDARDAATRPQSGTAHLPGPPVFPTANVTLPPVHHSRTVQVDASNGFDVTDAALGAGGAFAAIVIVSAGGVALRRRARHSLAA